MTPVKGEAVIRQSKLHVTARLTKGTHTLTTATLALVTLAMPARAPELAPAVTRISRPTSAARNASKLKAVTVTLSPLTAPGEMSARGRVPNSMEGGGEKATVRSFQQSSA